MNEETNINYDFDITKPRWDQSTFMGRLKHFLSITDPRLCVASKRDLEDAKLLVTDFQRGMIPQGTTIEQIWRAKHLYDSAYHPDSGQLMNVFGRMSFQMPGGMAITGLLLQFYKTPGQVALMQWFNQSFNALVNYTNRNAASSISKEQMLIAYGTATSTAVAVAIGLNKLASKASRILARCVPFAAVAAANAVNIPMTRQSEIINGILVFDEDGMPLGYSRKCALKGISQVVTSRISMAAPGMILLPVQVFGVGASLLVMVPIACSLFPQKSSMAFKNLEHDLQLSILNTTGKKLDYVYFNKGL